MSNQTPERLVRVKAGVYVACEGQAAILRATDPQEIQPSWHVHFRDPLRPPRFLASCFGFFRTRTIARDFAEGVVR